MEAFKRDGKELSARHEMLDDGLVLSGVILPPMAAHLGFMEQDPPLLTPIRQALNPWFTPQVVAARTPRIAAEPAPIRHRASRSRRPSPLAAVRPPHPSS
jgi:hypothetical protein